MEKQGKVVCDICKRETPQLIPKFSKKKRGYKGWKMVCRVCYERLSEDEDNIKY